MERFVSFIVTICAAIALSACSGAGSATDADSGSAASSQQSPQAPQATQPSVPATGATVPNTAQKNAVVVLPGMFGSVGEEMFYGNRVVIATVKSVLGGLMNNGSRVVRSSDIPAALTIDPILGRYDELLKALDGTGRRVVPLPYDWRKTPDQLVADIDIAISDAALQSPTGRVTVVAHSYGGLVIRACLQQGKCPHVDNVVFLGTPHQGVADAYYLRGGEPYGETRVDRMVLEALLSSMKTAYMRAKGILAMTDAVYVRDAWPSVATLLPTWDYIQVWDGGKFVPQTEYCLRNEWLQGLNATANVPWYRDTRILNVSGSGGGALATIGVHDEGILGCSLARWWPNGRPISAIELKLASVPGATAPSWRVQMADGDGLVTTASAVFPMGAQSVVEENYGVSHSGMLADPTVLARVLAFLAETDARH